MARARPGKAEPAVGHDVHALTARGHVDGADGYLIAHDNGRLGRAQLATRRNGRWCGCGRTDGDRDAVQQSAGDAAGPQLHSAAAALAAVNGQPRFRRRLHEPRARALAASPQYRSGVHADCLTRRSPLSTRVHDRNCSEILRGTRPIRMDSFFRRHDCAAVVKGLVGGVAVVTRPVRPDTPTLRRCVSESARPFSPNASVSPRPVDG